MLRYFVVDVLVVVVADVVAEHVAVVVAVVAEYSSTAELACLVALESQRRWRSTGCSCSSPGGMLRRPLSVPRPRPLRPLDCSQRP